MIAISEEFKNAMKQPIKELDAYLLLDDGTKIESTNDLIEIKLSAETTLCKTVMRKLEAKYLGERSLVGQWVHVGIGVKISDGSFDYLDYGSFLISDSTSSKDTETTTITGYDKMICSMVNYQVLDVDYPVDLFTYAQKICESCGLELGNTSFLNKDLTVDFELWKNITDTTYRDILMQIAQATCSICLIGSDDKVYFKLIKSDSLEELTYDNMKKWKLEELYGEINYVILGRDPVVGEDVFEKNDKSIEENGLTEFRIDNNQFLDSKREEVIESIYNGLQGFKYYPCNIETEGHGWYEIGDVVTVVNNENQEFETILLNYSLTVDGGIKETLKSDAETKTKSQYQYKSAISKQVRNTEIKVDKQNQVIEGVVTDVDENRSKITNVTQSVSELNTTIEESRYYYDEDGNKILISDTLYNLQQTVNGAEFTLNKAGGNNILRNTGLWFKNDEKDREENPYEFWLGKVTKNKNDKASNMTSLLLQAGSFSQEQEVPNGNYSVSFKYNKLISLANVKVIINGLEYELNNTENGEFATGTDEINDLVVSARHIKVEFVTDINNSCEIYDLMVNAGAVKLAYSQNQNETTTDTVNISKGITITSSNTDTIFKANADGIRTLDKHGNELTKFTDTGMTTKKMVVENEAQIVGVLVQQVGEQTWFTKL